MIAVIITKSLPAKTDCLIIPVFEDELEFPTSLLTSVDVDVLNELKKAGHVNGEARNSQLLHLPLSPYKTLVIVGMGKREAIDANVVRQAAGAVADKIVAAKAKHLAFVDLDGVDADAFLEGILLKCFRSGQFKAVQDVSPTPSQFSVIRPKAKRAPGSGTIARTKRKPIPASIIRMRLKQSVIKIESANWARALACSPANHLTPTILAKHAKEMAKCYGLKSEILGEAAMRRLKMGCLLAVSHGSEQEAKMIVLQYTHPKAKKTLALVGKGLTFDAGGISLKKPQGMENMKYDMCGGAAVLVAMRAIAQLRPKVNVVCVVPSSENLPDGKALKPGDVITASNDKTIEIISTDAEGRLILADALVYVIRRFKPDKVVDVATLTGAVATALGSTISAVLGNDADLVEELRTAGEVTHERLWELPLLPEYAKDLESNTADVKNGGTGPGTILGGLFLTNFVDDVAWAHLDVAGTASCMRHVSYLDEKYPSGFGTRLLTEWICNAFA